MILVTGGTGLLGAHLIHALHKQSITPRALYRSHIPAGVKDKAEWVQADILDTSALEEAFKGVTQVYHVAGHVSFIASEKENLHKINVTGTANIVNAALDAGIQKLIHVSSVAALGRIRQSKPIDETMSWTPETSNSEYGKSKYLGEMEVWRGIGEGLNAAIINPTIIIGEHGDWNKGSMSIFKNVHNGFPWYAMGSTGFVDANDIAEIMIQLMNSDINSQKFVVSNVNATYKDFMYMIAKAFNKKPPQKMVTPFLAAIVWRLEKIKSLFSKKEPLITKETAKTALTKANFNNSKLLAALPGFSYTPLETSINRICKALV
jgi:dihydroflavonol-4-reductase